MLWALRLVIAHDLLEYLDTWMTSEETCFFFCSTSRAVLKMFTRLFWIKASESLKKKFSRSYSCIHKEEKWRNGDKKSSRLLENA